MLGFRSRAARKTLGRRANNRRIMTSDNVLELNCDKSNSRSRSILRKNGKFSEYKNYINSYINSSKSVRFSGKREVFVFKKDQQKKHQMLFSDFLSTKNRKKKRKKSKGNKKGKKKRKAHTNRPKVIVTRDESR